MNNLKKRYKAFVLFIASSSLIPAFWLSSEVSYSLALKMGLDPDISIKSQNDGIEWLIYYLIIMLLLIVLNYLILVIIFGSYLMLIQKWKLSRVINVFLKSKYPHSWSKNGT